MTDNTELKRLAEASLGDWYEVGELRCEDRSGYINGLHHDDEYFIEAANPAAVLALIAENEALRKDAERWRFFSVLANDLQAFPHAWGKMTPEKMDAMCDQAMADAAMGKGELS